MTYKTDEELREEFEKKFKCIQSDCDGSGMIPHQVSEDEWEAQQCQFHAEYLFPIRDFIIAQRHADHQAIVEMVEKLKDENDDGMWAGRETVDKILSSLSHLEDKQKTQ